MIHPVILSGGTGTRLWPVSRQSWPKQFAPFGRPETLYQATLKRLSGDGFAPALVMTAEPFRFLATDQAEAAGVPAQVVVEPCFRDTAPAILAAALILTGDDPDALMLVAPSDHLIADPAGFAAALDAGVSALAGQGGLVTFGVVPDRAETGFGYLMLHAAPGAGAVPVAEFREKPDAASAAALLAGGRALWNAGLFLGRAADFIAAFEAAAADLMAPVRAAVAGAGRDLDFLRLGAAYEGARAISFDYAVMERAGGQAGGVQAVPMACGWSDLGAWDGLWAAASRDADGVAAEGPVTAEDCHDSYLVSDGPRLVALGLRDVVAVATGDAVLVADRGRAQAVKAAVAGLAAAGEAAATEHPRQHRPWGWYESLCLGPRFQVKRIMVKPGGALSLQSHLHRSEHWVVVAGTAEVTIGEAVQVVSENESVYIPLGTPHRLANPGKLPVYLIEVQTGAYLGEDDITRIEDVYHRT